MLVVMVALLAIAGPASAGFNSPTLLYETPTADVLPAGTLAISADVTYPLIQTHKNVNYLEADANVRFSPYRHLDFGLTAYTFADYVLDVKYQLVGEAPDRFGLAVGVYDVGFNSYVSPIGHDTANVWPDWKYNIYLPRYNRQTERFSAFVVTSIPVTEFARLHLGLGRGRFVGYDIHSEYLNSDYFFREYHEWAFGLFGGVELFLTPQVALVAEASGRDMNTGVKVNRDVFTATVAWTRMEGLLLSKGDERFGSIEFGATYKLGSWTRQRPPEAPTRPEELPPTPEVQPTPPIADLLRLDPIWFEWDKWDITPRAAATLRRNADVLLAHPNAHVVINGHASEEGTPEYNFPLSGRRAKAAFDYLKSLGVPEQQMRYRPMGVSAGRPYPLHLAVYFEIESEK